MHVRPAGVTRGASGPEAAGIIFYFDLLNIVRIFEEGGWKMESNENECSKRMLEATKRASEAADNLLVSVITLEIQLKQDSEAVESKKLLWELTGKPMLIGGISGILFTVFIVCVLHLLHIMV